MWARGTRPCLNKKEVKAGDEVKERIGYWLGVTWLMSLSDEDAVCTDLHWGETSIILVVWEEGGRRRRNSGGIAALF